MKKIFVALSPKRSKWLLMSLLLSLSLVFVSPTFAEETAEQPSPAGIEVALSPVYLDLYADFGLTLQPNTIYGGENGESCVKKDSPKSGGCVFKVINKGTKEFVANISVEPYSMTDENYEINSNQASARTELSKWINFERTKYVLKANEELSIPFTVTVPDDLSGGGQYAIIYVYAENQDLNGGMEVGSRLGLPIFARVDGETRVEASVKESAISGFLLRPPVAATSVVTNTGNVDVIAEYRLEVKNLFGKTVYDHKRSGHVMPETPRKVELAWDNAPSIGIFKVKQEVTLPDANGENHTTTTEKTVVVIPIWFIILAPLLIAGFIIIVIAKRKMLQATENLSKSK